jgi:threonyl-tRNA synthetase
MDITDEMRRHSAAHLTARAVCNLFPGAQTDIGPATDDGFYYDFDLEHRLAPEDFPAIEKEIARLIALDEPFVRAEMSRACRPAAVRACSSSLKLRRLHENTMMPPGASTAEMRRRSSTWSRCTSKTAALFDFELENVGGSQNTRS